MILLFIVIYTRLNKCIPIKRNKAALRLQAAANQLCVANSTPIFLRRAR